jgi:EAL domain-containing protein (putative c-di-GMP-specific phosphodiesterase class I)
MPDFVMSVNVSPVQFGGEGFDRHVVDAILECGVDPTKVILEITESTLMHSQERTERALATLRERGLRFSIDDFGTGFSSLAYLTRLPVSSIKIDKAFIRAIEHQSLASGTDKKLVTAMIDLAHSIDLKVVAEGVETEDQLAFLKQSGCNQIQGYLLGKPMSADNLLRLIAEHAGVPT